MPRDSDRFWVRDNLDTSTLALNHSLNIFTVALDSNFALALNRSLNTSTLALPWTHAGSDYNLNTSTLALPWTHAGLDYSHTPPYNLGSAEHVRFLPLSH